MSTSYPQLPEEELGEIYASAKRNLERAREQFKAERERRLKEGWLFQWSFDLWFETNRGCLDGSELLMSRNYEVSHRGDDRRIATVRCFLSGKERDIVHAQRELEVAIAPFGGEVEGGEGDGSRWLRGPGSLEELRACRKRLIADGLLFETAFDILFETEEGRVSGQAVLNGEGYEAVVDHRDQLHLIVRSFVGLDESEIARAAQRIDALAASNDGKVLSSWTDLYRGLEDDEGEGSEGTE